MSITRKLFRGTSWKEANELANGVQTRSITHWTDSFEKASMYGDTVIELQFEEVPKHLDMHQFVAFGNEVHGNIREWRLPKQLFEKDGGVYCHSENEVIHSLL
jgi:hypothetical protein